MNQTKVKELLYSLDPGLLWVEEFLRLINESDAELSSLSPGRAIAKEVLADSKIHKQTTAQAGIESTGFDELIAEVEKISPSERVLIIGIIGLTKRGVLYYTLDGKVLGGVVVARRPDVTR